MKIFDRDVRLRKKKELIRKFIEDNLPKIDRAENVEEAFGIFWDGARAEALRELSENEKITFEKLEAVIGDYVYTQRLPRDQEVVELLPKAPKIKERESIVKRIKDAIANIVDVFEW